MAKLISLKEAVDLIPDGATIMCGGFMGCGTAHKVVDALSKSGKSNFTLICNDGSFPGGPLGEDYYGVAKLIHNGQVNHLIATHVGLNPEVAERMNDGSMKVDLIPQGSLAEMIRAGSAGLGGVLTPTGVGTIVEDNKDFVLGKVAVDGKDYLHMRPVRADIAIISGYRVDKSGNVWYKGTTRNFNLLMATAADLVIVEADHVVELGEIEPENVHTYGILVDYIVDGGNA
ncbi:acetyl-CoA:acetoacetyl-CoA transferase, alpha subunit [uncultured Eubacteriales bacterium]|uniref:Acetyl-CoA:acetoacetyl-CoA transferase, alpha subunit n=1 Tax=uncultured Eubacteriales bacterium TaxID=172733 RepID=A0A212JFJ8_9FIRM|nr:acetyl-CoA:acetoacetyl-CoA transferase, alpha subunit [uncultured Eubacteriales bacterium]